MSSLHAFVAHVLASLALEMASFSSPQKPLQPIRPTDGESCARKRCPFAPSFLHAEPTLLGVRQRTRHICSQNAAHNTLCSELFNLIRLYTKSI